MKKKNTLLILSALVAMFLPVQTFAVELIVNGGFETGNFSGWTVVNSPSPWRPLQVTSAGQGGGFTSVNTTTVIQGTRNAWCGMTDNITTNSQWQLFQAVTVPAGQAITVSWRHRYQINHTQFCPGGACPPKFFFVEITNSTGTAVIQTLHTQSTIGNVNQDTGWVTRSVSLGGVGGQTIRLRFRGTETTPLTGPGQIEIDAVSLNTFVPTAAESTIAGRALDSNGRPIPRVLITVTDAAGTSRSVRTNTFGYYSLPGLNAGETYTLTAQHKSELFPDSPRVLNLLDNVNEVNFVASASIERLALS